MSTGNRCFIKFTNAELSASGQGLAFEDCDGFRWFDAGSRKDA